MSGAADVPDPETVAVVRRVEGWDWPDRDDAMGIHRQVAAEIVAPDLIQIHRVDDSEQLVDVAQQAEHIGIFDDALAVALEVRDIHGIEAHQGRP